jgi:hypothetical protein
VKNYEKLLTRIGRLRQRCSRMARPLEHLDHLFSNCF